MMFEGVEVRNKRGRKTEKEGGGHLRYEMFQISPV